MLAIVFFLLKWRGTMRAYLRPALSKNDKRCKWFPEPNPAPFLLGPACSERARLRNPAQAAKFIMDGKAEYTKTGQTGQTPAT
jgi:hypothetical protein